MELDNNKCPKCGSDEIEGDGVDIIRNGARQECWCNECGAEWYDWYVLDTVEIIEG